MSLILASLAAVAVAVFDGGPLVRNRKWGELATALVLLALGLGVAAFGALHLSPPDLGRLFSPLGRWLAPLWDWVSGLFR